MNSLKLADDVGHYFVSADVAVGVMVPRLRIP